MAVVHICNFDYVQCSVGELCDVKVESITVLVTAGEVEAEASMRLVPGLMRTLLDRHHRLVMRSMAILMNS